GAPRVERTDAEPAPQAPAPVASRPRRLLVIEERPHGLLSLVAESAVADLDGGSSGDGRGEVEIVTAVGAQEAAAALAAESCHCVVLQLDMPGDESALFLDALDGDAALRNVPVLAHNNRRLDPGREAALESRARNRPLELLSSLDELRERITLHLSAETPGHVLPLVRPEGSAAPALRDADGSLAGRTVLVVDDDTRNVFAITSILELHGMRVLHAENGRAGIEALDAHPGIDLILMDVMMPEMDGYTATAAIRESSRHAGLPIIMVTAKAMPGDQEKSLAAGANDYITKPLDADDLIACIHRWLGDR
ncbi:MAG TPA: response regulator, partial [Thermomonospora sp.]|nr:response regulator [Thermomonospora sp.]